MGIGRMWNTSTWKVATLISRKETTYNSPPRLRLRGQLENRCDRAPQRVDEMRAAWLSALGERERQRLVDAADDHRCHEVRVELGIDRAGVLPAGDVAGGEADVPLQPSGLDDPMQCCVALDVTEDHRGKWMVEQEIHKMAESLALALCPGGIRAESRVRERVVIAVPEILDDRRKEPGAVAEVA